MKQSESVHHEKYPDAYHNTYSRSVFGFWLYLLTDFIFFGTLFAAYAVLRNSTFGGPSAGEILHLPFALSQTLILLVSSFTIGLGAASAHRNRKKRTIAFFAISFVLGLIFFAMEFSDFFRIVESGNGWQRSAFLSALFTLLGTFALHMVFAILWSVVLIIPVLREGLTNVSIRRLTCLKMFWQFLNIIWIFIFSFVYIMGVKL